MLYPIMPLYLNEIGYGIVLIGILEGSAQLLGGLLKVFSGAYSDSLGNRSFFVRAGYSISAISKPLMGIFGTYGAIFVLRMFDRIGKGVRTAPRDAVLADESDTQVRGRVFSFHRAIDTFGATLGPVITLIILYVSPNSIRTIIIATIIPGILAIAATWLLKTKEDKRPAAERSSIRTTTKHLIRHWKQATPTYRKIVGIITVVTILKSTDIYLLLRAQELGLNNSLVVAMYVLYNAALALVLCPIGKFSDVRGFKNIYTLGVLALATTYGIFASHEVSLPFISLAFIIYALFVATYEGLSSAWISLYIKKEHRATGLGLMLGLQAIATFLGSLIVGLGWSYLNSQTIFAVIAVLTVLAAGVLYITPLQKTEVQ